MNKNVVTILAILAIGAIAYVGYLYLGSGTQAATWASACGFEGCDYRGNVNLKPGDPYPPKCPKCGRQGVLPLAKCPKCGNMQILDELRRTLPGQENLPEKTACNQCGGPIRHGD